MTTIGVLGGRWRASVSPTGSIEPWDDSAPLEWFIAADDRWHVPSREPAVRQLRMEGAPVLETRVRIPTGDAVHRVWCVADQGGFTVVEIENDSTLPFAVAFSRGDVLSARPPAAVPIQGIDMPSGSVVFPVGHHCTVQVALAHSPGRHTLPPNLATAAQVARGWTATVDRAGRILVPDQALADEVVRLRAELALNGPSEPGDDPVGFLLDVAQLVRLGERADSWVPDVADAVEHAAKLAATWDQQAALDAAAIVLARADEARAFRDLTRLRSLTPTGLPSVAPSPSRTLAWYELCLARQVGALGADVVGAELLAGGIPPAWLGANFEVYDLPIGPRSAVSFAVRWHGDRPAVLWETSGPTVQLSAPLVAPGWSSRETKGETLWPAPVPPSDDPSLN